MYCGGNGDHFAAHFRFLLRLQPNLPVAALFDDADITPIPESAERD